MTVGGIVLARLDSSRLSRKQLRLVRSRPMLDWLLERVAWIEGLDDVVLATSDRPIDDDLERYAESAGIACYRGSADDVAGRVIDCAAARRHDVVVRINGDSPLLDARLFTEAAGVFRDGDWDLVSNIVVRTYPVGNSVEVIRVDALRSAHARMSSPAHFEHVTPYLYEHPSAFRIRALTNPHGDWSRYSLAVDAPQDLSRLEWMLERVGGRHAEVAGARALELCDEYAAKATL